MPKPSNKNQKNQNPNQTGLNVTPEILDEYYSNFKTIPEKIDFLANMRLLANGANEMRRTSSDNLADDLEDKIIERSEELFRPRLFDKEGQPILDNRGRHLMDVETAKKNYIDFCRGDQRLLFQIGLEYQKALNSLPEDHPNREQAAGFMAQQSEPGIKYHNRHNIRMGLAMHTEKYSGFDGTDAINEANNFVIEEMKSSMTSDEKKLFEIGRDLCQSNPILLKGYKPEQCGLTEKGLDDLLVQNERNLYAKLDRNFYSKKTMNDYIKFLDPQVASDHHNRMKLHYLALDKQSEQIDFISDGAFNLESKRTINVNGGFDTAENISAFTEAEKNSFKECVKNYLTPLKSDGTLDHDEFERRMDGLAKKVADNDLKAAKYLMDADLSSVIGRNPTDPAARHTITITACPEYLQADALHHYINENYADLIDNRLINDYVSRKNKQNQDDPDAFISTFNKQIKNEAAISDPVNGKSLLKSVRKYSNGKSSLTPEEVQKIEDKSNQIKSDLLSNSRKNKVWLSPEQNITLESLKKLDNLHSQLKDADHWYHKNSSEFKNFSKALEEAHQKYQKFKDIGRELNDAEKKELLSVFDRTGQTAEKYLMDKSGRSRGTDMGQERYDIAFAAINTTHHGVAKKHSEYHNIQHERRGKKKVSLAELEERAGRTSAEEKAHKKAAKKAPKQKAVQQNNILDNNKAMVPNN